MGTPVRSLPMGSTSSALVFGRVVTGLSIAAETLVVYRQRRVAPEISLGAGLSGGRVTGWRLRERVMAPAEALWRARGDRVRMGSADER
jgi:hypothetical protein